MAAELAAQTRAIAALERSINRLAETNRRILELLAPKEGEGAGKQLAVALEALVLQIEQQNRLLRDLSGTFVASMRDMPAQIAEAVLTATSGFLPAMRDLPTRVVRAVRDNLR
ncbi:MAG: hypothetical protein M3Y55_10365 [Pseudomonadota bacterium]|nr:hypothetical protein [Pseudomonadota bacterium]